MMLFFCFIRIYVISNNVLLEIIFVCVCVFVAAKKNIAARVRNEETLKTLSFIYDYFLCVAIIIPDE